MRRASLPASPLPAPLLRAGSAGVLLLAGSAGGAFAQAILETPPQGSYLSATIAERFEINDNYGLDDPSPGTSYFADTRVGLDYLKVTDTQSLNFSIDTGLRALWEAEQDFDFVLASPSTADLGYQSQWANGAFDADFTYRERQVDYTVDTQDNGQPVDPLNPLQGDSREQRYDANVGVTWGTATRSSYELRFLGSRVEYTEEDPDQVARTTLQGQAGWNLQLTPVLASALTADYLDYSADNAAQTELDRSQLGAGLIYTPSETLTLGAGLDYAWRKRTDLSFGTGERVTTEQDDGAGINANFRYVLSDFVVNGTGEWTTASPDGGRFFGSLGGTYLLPRGRVTARVFQNYTGTSSGGGEARVTGAALQLVRDLNEVSNVAFNVSYAYQVDVDTFDTTPDPDIERMTLTAVYSHDITSSVSADVGYSYQNRDEDPESASSNAIFFQIAKAFDVLR